MNFILERCLSFLPLLVRPFLISPARSLGGGEGVGKSEKSRWLWIRGEEKFVGVSEDDSGKRDEEVTRDGSVRANHLVCIHLPRNIVPRFGPGERDISRGVAPRPGHPPSDRDSYSTPEWINRLNDISRNAADLRVAGVHHDPPEIAEIIYFISPPTRTRKPKNPLLLSATAEFFRSSLPSENAIRVDPISLVEHRMAWTRQRAERKIDREGLPAGVAKKPDTRSVVIRFLFFAETLDTCRSSRYLLLKVYSSPTLSRYSFPAVFTLPSISTPH